MFCNRKSNAKTKTNTNPNKTNGQANCTDDL